MAYYKFTILITHIVIIIFENLEDVLSIFFVLRCVLFLFCCCGLFIVDLHFTHSSTLCTKLAGLNLLVILGKSVISFAA